MTSGPGNELQAFNSLIFHPVIHSTQNDVANVICEKRNVIRICTYIPKINIFDNQTNKFVPLECKDYVKVFFLGTIKLMRFH